MKTCCRCLIKKEINEFGKLESSHDNLRDECRECRKVEYYKNHDKMLNDKRLDYKKHREERLEKCREYYNKNKEKICERQRIWSSKNRDKIKINNRRGKLKRKKTPFEKAIHYLRNRIYKILRKSGEKIDLSDLIGNLDSFKIHIESFFLADWTWENHANLWYIDFVKNPFFFNLENPEEGKDCFGFANFAAVSDEKYNKNINEIKKLRFKIWAEKNVSHLRARRRNYTQKNPEKMREYWRRKDRKKRATIQGRLEHRMSGGLLKALKRNKNRNSWESLVGYTAADLKKHLESLFINGMNWEAFMKGEIHIDHKVPKSAFTYENPADEQFQQCWALSNLQPMWGPDNLEKRDKISEKYNNLV